MVVPVWRFNVPSFRLKVLCPLYDIKRLRVHLF